MPFFSIITPSFNQGKYLAACLGSVSHQGDEDYEHIIIDNCSTDETVSILAHYAKKPQAKVIIEPDRGQSEAVNKGFRLAQGEIICWLNSDDAYLPGTFAQLRKAFADPKVAVVFGDVRQVSYDGRLPERAVARFEQRYDLVRWWSNKVKLHQPAIFFRRSVCEEIGLLKESLHYAMDYDYWWRLSEQHRFHYLPKELALQHRQPDSKTMKAWTKVLKEREKIFSQFYGVLGQESSELKKERTQTLASHYLLQAYTAVTKNRRAAWFYLGQALQQSPGKVLQASTLGLIRKLCFL